MPRHIKYKIHTTVPILFLCFSIFFLAGCARLFVPSMLAPFSASLTRQTDVDLLREGLPSFLLTLDGLVHTYPDNREILLEAARGYSFYTSLLEAFEEDAKTAAAGRRARKYGIRLIESVKGLEGVASLSIDKLGKALPGAGNADLPFLFWGAQAWAVWVKHEGGSPEAAAQFPKLKLIMQRVLELDETYYYGSVHVFFGAYLGSFPAMFGGDPERSRIHFERALEIGKRRFLLALVTYAETYARQVMDRDLYAALLREVLDAPVTDDELAAVNALAKRKALIMLEKIDEYF